MKRLMEYTARCSEKGIAFLTEHNVSFKEYGYSKPNNIAIKLSIYKESKKFETVMGYIKRNAISFSFVNSRLHFTHKDFLQSQCLNVNASWALEPAPLLGRCYQLEHTHNTLSACEECGAGAIQRSPYLLKKEPQWKNRLFFTLKGNGNYEPLFVEKEVYSKIFKDMNIGFIPVLDYKTGEPLKTVVQLDIPTLKSGFVSEGYMKKENCPICGISLYQKNVNELQPGYRKNDVSSNHIWFSAEVYNVSLRPRRALYISNFLYQLLQEQKIKGLNYYACNNY